MLDWALTVRLYVSDSYGQADRNLLTVRVVGLMMASKCTSVLVCLQ